MKYNVLMDSFASERQSWLAWFFKGLLVVFFILLFARLFELQIIKGKYYRTLAEGNRIRKVALPAPRGQILARGGETLIGNVSIKKKIIFNVDGSISKSDDLAFGSEGEIITDYLRDYLLGSGFAHAGGYLGEVNKDEVGNINPRCPEKGPKKPGDLVGRSGLEEEYDCLLRGVAGEELVEVDIHGKKVRVLGKKDQVPGEDLKTNIDFKLQAEIAGFLDKKKGAIIVSDPKGEILAFYSSPSFDPKKVVQSLEDPDLPLFNRAISGLYHPGSVFKPFVVIAALEEKKIDKDYLFDDTGVLTVKTLYGTFSYYNWYFTQYGKAEGKINLVRAITRSTDTFFYNLGEMVGINRLDDWAGKFGLAAKTGIDLPGEIVSLVPTPEWKLRVKGESWFLGNTYHFSIGQGDLALTPIALNSAVMAIASGGVLCQPRVVGSDNKCKNLKISQENLDLVKQGMVGACSIGGTGYTFFDLPDVGCKTGTAETNEDGKTHAWFTVFTPADLPEVVVTVLVERGGEGSKVAGPIARSILDYWNLLKNP